MNIFRKIFLYRKREKAIIDFLHEMQESYLNCSETDDKYVALYERTRIYASLLKLNRLLNQ